MGSLQVTTYELGLDARRAYAMADAAGLMGERMARIMGRVRDERADAYEDALERAERSRDMLARQLGEDVAEAWERRDVDGQLYKEIAAGMGLTGISAARRLFLRARAWLDR